MELFGGAFRNAEQQSDEGILMKSMAEEQRNKAEVRGIIAGQIEKERKEKKLKALRKPFDDKKHVRNMENLRAKLVSNISKSTKKRPKTGVHKKKKQQVSAGFLSGSDSDDDSEEKIRKRKIEFGNLSIFGDTDVLDSEGNSIKSDESLRSFKENVIPGDGK